MTDLPEEVGDALFAAWLVYKKQVEIAFGSMTNEELLAHAGSLTQEESRLAIDPRNQWRALAKETEFYRRLDAAAKPVLDAGGQFCVTHWQDSRLCDPKDHE